MKKNIPLYLAFFFVTNCLFAQQNEEIPLEYDTSGYASSSGSQNTFRTIPSNATGNDTIPSIKSEMNVSDTGSMTYMVPIDLIKGLNNFQPNVALSYNSQSANGQAGYGWNIIGLSMISRGGKSKSIDGFTVGPQFDATDPFYLDGQRLIGTNATVFETEKYSKIKITKSAAGATYSFVVQYTDGKIAKYKELLPGQHYISVLIDALNNEVHYTYTVENNVPYITAISYGNTSLATDRFKILFNYINRVVATKTYRNGTEFKNTKVLHEILVASSLLNTNGGIYRKYTLFYDYIHANTVERLIKITLVNEKGLTLKPLEFTYNNTTSGVINYDGGYNSGFHYQAVGLGTVAVGDFYGRGKAEAVFETKQENGTYQLFDSSKYVIASYPHSKKYFAGKTLINGKISENDQLISMNTYDNFVIGTFSTNLTICIRDLASGTKRTIVTEFSFNDLSSIDKFITGDFNNDGLIDAILTNRGSNDGGSLENIIFIEVGKSTTNLLYTTFGGAQLVNGQSYPVEFDGDGIPEIMFLCDYCFGFYSIYKLNFLNNSLDPITTQQNLQLSNYTDKTPLFFGDYNGDGLTDFITPTKIYSLENNSSAAKELQKMETEPQLWWEYISNGTTFIKTLKDYTAQKLAYMAPTQRNVISYASDWDKFWSGAPDTYDFTEYGSSNIYPVDFNNDGKTDLISVNKFGKAKYPENGRLYNTTIENLNQFSYFNFSLPINQWLVVVNSTHANKVLFHENRTNADGSQALVNLATEIPLGNVKISPLSLILNDTSYNQLNTYKSGLTIYDPITHNTLNYGINNDNFNEGLIREVDNGSPIIQKIEYRQMVEKNNTNAEVVYSTFENNLSYPYYTHKNVSTNYLVYKIHTAFDSKILTKEYRYQNGIQHLDGKGFLGFQKTFVSDTYESLFVGNKYQVKEIYKGLFWKINTNNPLMENAVTSTTYGSLNSNSVFSKTQITNQKFDKGNHHYLILSTVEQTTDYLKGITVNKSYQYDTTGDLLLQQINSDYNGQSAAITNFTYTPEFANGDHNFFGKIAKTENTQLKDGMTFTTKDEQTYNTNGTIQQTKKYGNGTPAIETNYAYHPFGEIQSETLTTTGLATPLTTSYIYEATNRYVWKVTTPDGLISITNITPLGRITSLQSGLGLTTSYKYDGWGNAKENTDPLGKKTTITKLINASEPAGNYSISNKREGGVETIATFDKFDRQIMSKTQTLNSQWVNVKTDYDIFGKKTQVSEPYFDGETPLWNRIEYDELNRPIKQFSFNGKLITTCYEGLKVTVEDGIKKTSKWLDASGNVIKHKDFGGEIYYKYYPNGALKETDYAGIKTKIEIDGWGNKTKLDDPSAGVYRYEYDNLSRIKKDINPKGGITLYTYDDLGRPLTENTTSAAENTTIVKNFQYNPTTKLPTVVSGTYNAKSYTYTTFYDNKFRINGKKEETPDFTYETTTSFDDYGRVNITELKTTLVNPSYVTTSHVKNLYDANGILTKQLDNDTSGTIWEVNAINSHGMTTQMSYGNGYTVNTTYNNTTFALEKLKHDNGTSTVVDINYTYNVQRGILLNRNNLVFGKDETYEYDDLDRLLVESTNGTTIQNYTYDKRGRMTSNTDVGKYNFNEQDYKLQSINFNSKGSTLNGSRGFAEIQYNAFKNPNEIYLAGKDRISFDYSILKTRSVSYYGSLSTTAADRPNRKYYSADKAIEIVREGALTKIITYVTGDPYSANYMKVDLLTGGSLTSSNHYYLHRDNQSTIVAITSADASGTVIEKRYFDAWGNLKNAVVAGTAYAPNAMGWVVQLLIDRGYTGHEFLKTVGLVHMNGRIYDPVLRRFMSPDNYVQDPYNTQNFNRYGYVWNNPLLYVDPSGEFGFIAAIIIGAVVGMLANGINNSMQGIPFWYGAGKAGFMGAVSGAISFGIGSIAADAFGQYFSVGKALFQAGMHGMTSGMMSAMQDGSFASGFAAGAISSLVSSGIEGLADSDGMFTDEDYTSYTSTATRNPELMKATMLAAGGLSGGLSSSIAGGKFIDGVKQGLITSGLNHLAHMVGDPPSKANKLIAEYEKNENKMIAETMVMETLLETTENGDILTEYRDKVIENYGDYRDKQINDVVSKGVSLIKDIRENLGNSKLYDLAVYKASLGLGADIIRLRVENYNLSSQIKNLDINYYYKINPTEKPYPINIHYVNSGGGAGGSRW